MPGQIAWGIRATVDRGLCSQHVHHGCIGGGAVLRCGAFLAPAPAGQVGLQSGQRPDCVGAALLMAARILLTHRVGHRIQALIQRHRLDSINIGPNRAMPGVLGSIWTNRCSLISGGTRTPFGSSLAIH